MARASSMSSKRLKDLLVSDIVADKKVPGLRPEERVQEARRLMREMGLRSVPVIEPDGGLIGVVTRGDVLMASSSKSEATVGSLALMPPVVLRGDERVQEALKSLVERDQWDAPVVDSNGRYVTLFELSDVIRLSLSLEAEALRSIKVSDVMSRNIEYARVDDYVSKIWRRMVELRYAGLPVVDEELRVVGMITQYDLIAKGYSRIHLESESGPSRGPKVVDVMNRPAAVVYPWSELYEVADLMVKRRYGRVPVVESPRSPRLVGIVDREDIIRALIQGGDIL